MELRSSTPKEEVKLKVGVIGCGHLGSIHARVYNEIPGVELIGVQDRSATAAGAVADKQGCRAYPDLESLAEAADALSICVPTPAHCEVALPALERDCHLLVEKPIAHDIAAAERMLEAADRRGLQLMVGHVERFNPAMIAALPHFDSPGFVESHRLSPFGARGADVAVVLDLMIHDIDLLSMVIGREVLDLDASGSSVLTGDVDIANARLRFDGGCVANITASRISRDRMRKLRFFQADGYLSVDLLAGQVEFIRKRLDFDRLLAGAMAQDMAGVQLTDFVEQVPVVVEPGEPLRLELEAFTSALAAGKSVPVDGKDGLRALGLAVKILERMQRGT